MLTMSTTEARKALSELTYRVQYGGEAAVLTRRGEPCVALVSTAALRELSKLEELQGAKFSELRRQLGLDHVKE